MRRTLVILVFALLCSACAQVRYWKAEDPSTRRTYYTVDTNQVPFGSAGRGTFVSSDGKLVGLATYELTPMTREEWEAATGGAGVHKFDAGNMRMGAVPVPPKPKPKQ